MGYDRPLEKGKRNDHRRPNFLLEEIHTKYNPAPNDLKQVVHCVKELYSTKSAVRQKKFV